MTNEVNDQYIPVDHDVSIGGSKVTLVEGYRWKDGKFQFKVVFSSNENTWKDYKDLKLDNPRLLAGYIIAHASTIKQKKLFTKACISWAKKTYCDFN